MPQLGLDIYKVGMVWPLAHHDALEFVAREARDPGVEEKRGIIESQFKEYFYDYPGHKPERMVGKNDENNHAAGAMDRRIVAAAAGADRRKRLDAMFPGLDLHARAERAARRRRDHRHRRRHPHALFLLGLSAQHVDESA